MIKKDKINFSQISNIYLTNIRKGIKIYYIVEIRGSFFEDFRQ